MVSWWLGFMASWSVNRWCCLAFPNLLFKQDEYFSPSGYKAAALLILMVPCVISIDRMEQIHWGDRLFIMIA
ncbi:hypothetical protein B0W47_06530 [Komagataeibacter nataicola]|uniref:Uncharacterized protein n=1 Tax=Komagataeibacter nataicola TaxID=265960 RepID=A0A9N7CCR4_9PROT|nr:hypothetical protein B0W47_06530 [Komagataeibacter nataicola]PYD65700.1 hypothetical protein CDI09_11985 [Komagataeibacter nataicola]